VSDGTVLWVLILAALVVAAVIVMRRMSRLVARTRDLELFQGAVAALDARFAGASEPS
jgi:hypothetical protein